MKSALIENGIVTNIIEGEATGHVPIPDGVRVDIGVTYDGRTFGRLSGPPAPTKAEMDGRDAETIEKLANPGSVERLLFQIAFAHENRIRALEGKQAISVETFRDAVKAKLR